MRRYGYFKRLFLLRFLLKPYLLKSPTAGLYHKRSYCLKNQGRAFQCEKLEQRTERFLSRASHYNLIYTANLMDILTNSFHLVGTPRTVHGRNWRSIMFASDNQVGGLLPQTLLKQRFAIVGP